MHIQKVSAANATTTGYEVRSFTATHGASYYPTSKTLALIIHWHGLAAKDILRVLFTKPAGCSDVARLGCKGL